MGTRGSFPGGKTAGDDADHLHSSSVEIKNAWSCTSTPNTPLWRGGQLKHRDNFTFTFAFYTSSFEIDACLMWGNIYDAESLHHGLRTLSVDKESFRYFTSHFFVLELVIAVCDS
jgi:hypothetical protein